MPSLPSFGDLRYQIDLIQPGVGDGYDTTPATTVASGVWANVEDLSGLELVRAQMISAKATHRVTIRYRAVSTSMQVVFGSRTFDIQGILDVGKPRGTWLQLLCAEGPTA